MKNRHQKELNYKKSSLLFIKLLLFFLVVNALSIYFPIIRYGNYLLPVLAIIFSIITKKQDKVIDSYFNSYMILYFVLVSLSFLLIAFRNDIYLRFFEEAFFIFAPLLTVKYMFYDYKIENTNLYYKILIWGLISLFFLERGSDILGVLNPKIFEAAVLDSTISTESSSSFLFGLLSVHFWINKKRRYFIVTLILTIISFKRIAIGAVFISILLYQLMELFNSVRIKKWIPFIAVLANLLIVYFLYNLFYGYYNYIINDITGISTNAFFMGRQTILNYVIASSELNVYAGAGLGKINDLLLSSSIGLLLHSDIIKIFIEFGLILFIVWIYILYKINRDTLKETSLLIYMNVLFITDNTLIYFNVMFLFYLLQGINHTIKKN